MEKVRAARTRKKEYCVKVLFASISEKEDVQSLLENIGNKTRLDNGENVMAALEMYYESLKAGK